MMASQQAPTEAAGCLRKTVSLRDHIDLAASSSLNNCAQSNLREVLGDNHGDNFFVASDAEVDEQLLIKIVFSCKVWIKSIAIRSAQGPPDSSGPLRVRLFRNAPNMDFGDAEDQRPVDEFELDAATQLQGKTAVALHRQQWRQTDQMTLFVESNQSDDDVSFLNRLVINGIPSEGFNMNDLKKSG